MIFVNDISELQYYNQSSLSDCYCDVVIAPDDMSLQIKLPAVTNANYSLIIQQYDVSGQNLLATITGSFQWVVFNSGGYNWCNIQLISFPESMCQTKCFILRVRIILSQGSYLNTVFDKYTEQYCVDSCCFGSLSGIEVKAGSEHGPDITNPALHEYDPADYDMNEYR